LNELPGEMRRPADCLVNVLDAIRKTNPTVFALLIHRDVRLRKTRISEGADGNCHYAGYSVQQIEDRGAAFRTEVKPGHAALVPDKHKFFALTFYRHLVSGKPGLGTEYATGSPLARQAMTDRNPDWITLSFEGELSAATGREMTGHGTWRPESSRTAKRRLE